MRASLKRMIAAFSPFFNYSLGRLVSEGEPVGGRTKHSYVKCRIKQTVDEQTAFLSLEFKPDFYIGPEGNVKNFIELDMASARHLHEELGSYIDKLELWLANHPEPGGSNAVERP